jgi:hypothetical protein
VNHVVLTYTGIPEHRQSAEDHVRSMPGAVLTAKAADLFEAQLDEHAVQALQQDPNWTVSRPSYAEIRSPAMNLKSARSKLTGNR